MLNELQRLFKETWSAFRTELGRREPEDEVADLLGLMRQEMVRAKAVASELKEAARDAQGALRRERELLAECERRGQLAERIGDQETVRVAQEFADRHRERVAVLEAKAASTTSERDLQQRELAEMTQRYQNADRNRFVLVSELRRRRAAGAVQDALNGDTGAFGDFARMEETIEQAGAEADALEELSEDAGSRGGPTRERPSDVEDRLRELKRRMGKE
jgi:phage shock protein A